MIPLIFLILGRAWEAAFDAIYGDPAHFADLRSRSGSIFFVMLFTVIPLMLLILGHAWEAAFDANKGDPAHFSDPRTLLGSRFCCYLQ